MKSDPLRAGRFCESTARPRLRYRTENQNRLFPCITCCGFACVASFVSFSDRPAFQISRLSHGLWNTRLDNRRVRAGGAKLNRLSRRIPTTGIREPTNDDLLVFIRFRFFPRNYNPIRKHSQGRGGGSVTICVGSSNSLKLPNFVKQKPIGKAKAFRIRRVRASELLAHTGAPTNKYLIRVLLSNQYYFSITV